MNAMEESKAEKGDGAAPHHLGHEMVSMLLGLITEMEIFDQSLKGRKEENHSKLLLRGKQGKS